MVIRTTLFRKLVAIRATLYEQLQKNLPQPVFKILTKTYRFFKNDLLFGTLLYPYGLLRHRTLLKNSSRNQAHTYTSFYRIPLQFETLLYPVMAILMREHSDDCLQINVFACSTGAEPYTVASVLLDKFPNLNFFINASDLHQGTIDVADRGIYTSNQVHHGGTPQHFIDMTFDKIEDRYQVKPHIRKHISFTTADLLDTNLGTRFPKADIVFAQNVFFHLDPIPARQAFRNVLQSLKPVSALFIDGMDIDMREEMTSKAGLFPLNFKCSEIYECGRDLLIGRMWWNYYYGTPPYAGFHKKPVRRYCTIYFNGIDPNA